MKQIGSQTRQSYKEAGYRLVNRGKREVTLQDVETGKLELWQANNHHAGYTVSIGRWGYEFVRSL